MSQLQLQVKTPRTLCVDFMREPFGGRWLGEPGWFTVAQLAEGTGLESVTVRRTVKGEPGRFAVRAVGGVYVYALKAALEGRT